MRTKRSGSGNGKRTQENGVDDGEDGDVRADTKSQGQQRDRGESRALQQSAQGVARILQGLFDPRNGPLVAMQFFGLLDAAERAARWSRASAGFMPRRSNSS